MYIYHFATLFLILNLSIILLFLSPSQQKGVVIDVHGDPTVDNASSKHNLTDAGNGTAVPCENRTLEVGEYQVINGTLFVEKLNLTLDEPSYHVTNDSVTICAPKVEKQDCEAITELLSCYTRNGIILSFTSLLVLLMVFWFITDLKHLAFWSLISVAFLLIFSFWVYGLIDAVHLDKISAEYNFAYKVPTVIHITLLTSVSWMSILSSGVFYTSSGRRMLKKVNGKIQIGNLRIFHRRIALLAAVSFFSIIFVNRILVKPLAAEIDPFCWDIQNKPSLGYFAGLVFVLAVMNFESLALSYLERRTLMKQPGFELYLPGFGQSHYIFMIFSTLMYSTWCIGALASIPALEGLWDIFKVMTVLEAILVFCLICFLDVQGSIIKDTKMVLKKKNTVKSFDKYPYVKSSKEKEIVKQIKNKIMGVQYPLVGNQQTVYCAVLVEGSEPTEIRLQDSKLSN